MLRIQYIDPQHRGGGWVFHAHWCRCWECLDVEANPPRLELRPITRDEARRFVAVHHRHNEAPQGWLFGVSVVAEAEVVGVGMAGRPVAPGLQDGRTIEVTRVCTPVVDARRNTCSKIYGALCRAAAALGYTRVITYTLAEEDAISVRAAGFEKDAVVLPRTNLNTGNRLREQVAMFDPERRPTGRKVRWVRWLK